MPAINIQHIANTNWASRTDKNYSIGGIIGGLHSESIPVYYVLKFWEFSSKWYIFITKINFSSNQFIRNKDFFVTLPTSKFLILTSTSIVAELGPAPPQLIL